MARCASMARWHERLAEVRVLDLVGCVYLLYLLLTVLSQAQGAVPGPSESGCLSVRVRSAVRFGSFPPEQEGLQLSCNRRASDS